LTNEVRGFTNSWVSVHKSRPQARLRLFCFPHAGAGASIYRTWSDDLPAEVEVCPVQLPGRENRLREPAVSQLPLLVEMLAGALWPYMDRPFAFFGHSMGGLISFELARQLRRLQHPGPVHLFVAGCPAPQTPDPFPRISELPDRALVAELRRLNGVPALILQHAEMMRLVLPLMRADLALAEHYVYLAENPLDCPISAFGGRQDNAIRNEYLPGWREQTRSTFTLRVFEGDHFFLKSARTPLLQAVSWDLSQNDR
jgi:surfactin synthase thioesterase subunit